MKTGIMERNSLDKRSFILGMVTAFSECVASGGKRMALSPPLTKTDYDMVSVEADEIIKKHGLISYHEYNLDQPEGIRFRWILIAGKQETINEYLSLRKKGLSPVLSLEPFSDLLSYNPAESVHTGYDAFQTLFR